MLTRRTYVLVTLAFAVCAARCDRPPSEPATRTHGTPGTSARPQPSGPPPIAHALPFAPNVNSRNAIAVRQHEAFAHQDFA